MMNRLIALSFALFLSAHAQGKLIVHEWGTFTSLVGSNGQAQNGMYQEDEPLPDFVHNFGDQNKFHPETRLNLFAWAPPEDLPPTPQPAPSPHPPPRCPGHPKVPCEFLHDQMITQKMETPVVYFYSDTSQRVNFDVSFPGGIISQSYPATSFSHPQAVPGVELKNGFAHYEVNILKNSTAQPPFVDPSNIYSFARNVASDLIQVGQETERFIFYRGLGEFKTKLLTTSTGGKLDIENLGTNSVPQIFLISTDGKTQGDIISLDKLAPRGKINVSAETIHQLMSSQQPHKAFLKRAKKNLLSALTKAGLFKDEARAMINTWQNGYFKNPGLRILYILSRSEVEEILPAQVSPKPDEFNRVFVGRIEVLLDTTEEQILQEILQDTDRYDVSRLGRMAHPTLLRVQELAQSKGILTPELSETIKALIMRIP